MNWPFKSSVNSDLSLVHKDLTIFVEWLLISFVSGGRYAIETVETENRSRDVAQCTNMKHGGQRSN